MIASSTYLNRHTKPAKREWNILGILSLVSELSILIIIFVFGTKYYTGADGKKVVIDGIASDWQILGQILPILMLALLILGIVLGHLGIRKSKRQLRGLGFAIAGLVFGYGFIAVFVAFVTLALSIVFLSGRLN